MYTKFQIIMIIDFLPIRTWKKISLKRFEVRQLLNFKCGSYKLYYRMSSGNIFSNLTKGIIVGGGYYKNRFYAILNADVVFYLIFHLCTQFHIKIISIFLQRKRSSSAVGATLYFRSAKTIELQFRVVERN